MIASPSLIQLIAAANVNGIAPVVVDAANENTTYVGYCLPSCAGYDDNKWLIKRVLKDGNLTTISWTNGVMDFNQVWSNRTNLTYKLNEKF